MKNLNRYLFLLIGIIGLPAITTGQLPRIVTSIDRNNILIGEQINVDVQVVMPASRYKLTWFTVPQEFGAFVPVSQDRIDTAYQTGVFTFSQLVTITSFDSGSQVIPPLTLSFETLKGDSVFRMYTDSIPVEVRYSPADSILPFHDIKPIISVKKETPWWLWPAIIAGIILLGLLIYLYLRKKSKNKSNSLFDSPLTPYEEARQLLEDLDKEDLPSKKAFKLFYLKLTDIYKRYISRISEENKMHLTGSEIIKDLRSQDVDPQILKDFSESLSIADAVKFARFTPAPDDCANSLQQVSNIINQLNSRNKEDANDI